VSGLSAEPRVSGSPLGTVPVLLSCAIADRRATSIAVACALVICPAFSAAVTSSSTWMAITVR